MVEAAFQAQRAFLEVAASSRRPSSQSDLASLLRPTSLLVTDIQTHRESRRRSEYFNHLSAVSESIPALGWVSVVSSSTRKFCDQKSKKSQNKFALLNGCPVANFVPRGTIGV
jgi:hypothetical protein